MFCTNCGNNIEDDAVFCIHCGQKIVTEIQKKQTEEVSVFDYSDRTPAVKFMEPAVTKKEEIVPVEIIESPMMDSRMFSPIGIQGTSPLGIDTTAQTNQLTGTSMPMIEMKANKQKDSILPLKIISIIFSILTIAAAIVQVIYEASNDGEIINIIWALSFAVVAITLVLFSVKNNVIISRVKGITFIMLIILDVVFVGFSTLKYSFNELFTSSLERNETIYMIVLIVMTISLYVYLLFDAIRSLVLAKGMKTLTVFVGYIPLLAVILQIVIKALNDNKIKLMMGFLPTNTIIALFLLASMFGVAARKRK